MYQAVYFLVGILFLFVIVKVFSWPIKMLLKLILNAIAGFIILLIVNFFGQRFGITIGINPITALIAGFCGVPGVIFLIIFKLFL